MVTLLKSKNPYMMQWKLSRRRLFITKKKKYKRLSHIKSQKQSTVTLLRSKSQSIKRFKQFWKRLYQIKKTTHKRLNLIKNQKRSMMILMRSKSPLIMQYKLFQERLFRTKKTTHLRLTLIQARNQFKKQLHKFFNQPGVYTLELLIVLEKIIALCKQDKRL